ncbi:hypothetical protein Tco_0539565 [Tanacetum coccineum]
MKLEKALIDFDSHQERILSSLGAQLGQQQDDMISKINLLWKAVSEKLDDTPAQQNRNLLSPKRVYFVNLIIILNKEDEAKESTKSSATEYKDHEMTVESEEEKNPIAQEELIDTFADNDGHERSRPALLRHAIDDVVVSQEASFLAWPILYRWLKSQEKKKNEDSLYRDGRGNGVAGFKRRRRDLSSDGVMDLMTASGLDPQCSTQIHGSNTITICPKRPGESQTGKLEEEEHDDKDNPENINTNPFSPPDLSVSFIAEKVFKLNSFFESLGLVPQTSNTEFVCMKYDDGDMMFLEIIKKNDESNKEEPKGIP